MKRNWLTAIAIMVTAVFVGLPIAEAVDVKLGGEFLTRWEARNQDFNDDSSFTDLIGQRTRLNANVNMNDRTSAFIQLQSNQLWGRDGGQSGAGFAGLGLSPAGQGEAGTGTGAPNDADASVGVHQAYFTLKKFFNLPVDLQVGRQELILDGHRLVGNTFWTFGASTHDAVKLTHNHGNHTLMYFYSRDIENADFEDEREKDMHIFYGQLRKILGGALSFTYVFQDDSTVNGTASAYGVTAGPAGVPPVATVTAIPFTEGNTASNDIHTIGLRQAGVLKNWWNIIYRLEVYGQFGDAACGTPSITAASAACDDGVGTEVDRAAFMVGARIGKKFNNFWWKPKVTLWYDYLSGDDDATDDDHNAFNTVVDTGHKYYGLQDVFLGVGAGAKGSAVAGTGYRGLQDLALKINTNPMNIKGLGFNMDVHAFWTAEGANRTGEDVSSDALINDDIDPGDHFLGSEIDLTLYYWYNPYIKFTAGYSHFFAEDLLSAVQGRATSVTGGGRELLTGTDDQDWAYLMMNMQF